MRTIQGKRNFVSIIFGLSFALLVPHSYAVTISPVQLNLSVKNPIVSFTVTNDSETILTYQAVTLSWSQTDGKDVQEDTTNIIVTPPIVSINPNSLQVFRVALHHSEATSLEQTYRIVLEDISENPDKKVLNGLSFRFNHNLPVFYAPLSILDLVVWSMCETKIKGMRCLMIENKGNVHAKIIKLSVVSATAKEPNGISKTLLAGSASQWIFPSMLGLEETKSIELLTNKGPLTLNIKDLPRFK